MATPNLEQLTAAQKANAEVITTLLRTSFEGVQRLAELNLAASRDFFNASVSNASTLLAAKDANEFAALNQQLAKPGLDKLMDYSRQVYDLVTQLQKEITGVVETQYSQFSKEAATAIDKTKTASPVGGDVFAAAMKSMLDQTNKAFESMNAVTRQMTEIAESNLKTVTQNVRSTASAPAPATKAAAKK
jgi:phasin family protein